MRFSVIIPTHGRRDLVVRHVRALERQVERDFEVIVVVDGSSDDTAQALRRTRTWFPLRVIEQENRGPSAARNAGAAAAGGEYLLFLDDDMEADPQMLREHWRSHREGADLVLGDLPLHPASPRNLLSWGVGLWARARAERLAAAEEVPPEEVITGQLSVSREHFERLGGFDVGFTAGGLAPGADFDFGRRARALGLAAAFNPAAISHQYYDVDPGEYLRRARRAGRAHYLLRRKHPERFAELPSFERRRDRLLFTPLTVLPSAFSWPLRAASASLARRGHTGPRLRSLFFLVRTMERERGLRLARRESSRAKLVVLAYHAIADRAEDPLLRPYSVPPQRFVRQLEALRSAGWRFADPGAAIGGLAGAGLARGRWVLLTFDDGYRDFAEVALPELVARRIPAAAFVVAGQVGASNEWDQRLGGGAIGLMDAGELRRVAAAGVEIGSHGLRHRSLAGVDPAEALAEASDSADALESLGLPRPRLFAYPWGRTTPAARAAVAQAGYAAAFTTTPEFVKGSSDPYSLPRVIVLRGYTPVVLRLRLATLGWAPAWLERAFELLGARL
jgi:GT2 family glycosyltransferase/peptidoglycan/xylan/chitin deacetylase (PgdA/CDA1 family)